MKSKAERDLAKRQREARIAAGLDPKTGSGDPIRRPRGAINITPEQEEREMAKAAAAAKSSTTTKSTGKPSATAEQIKGFPTLLSKFASTEGSTDRDAPINEQPFVQNGRLYFKARPLIAWVAETQGFEISPSQLREAVTKLGGDRAPFGFKLNGKQTGASHYSIPKAKAPGLNLGEREKSQGSNGSAPAAKKQAAKKSPAKSAAKSAPRTAATKATATAKAKSSGRKTRARKSSR
jgi:hypothetical protein